MRKTLEQRFSLLNWKNT